MNYRSSPSFTKRLAMNSYLPNSWVNVKDPDVPAKDA
jgi:hypothetical protein